jgi:hypothetical protein
MIADARAGAAGGAWSLDVAWPGEADRASTFERVRRDPAYAAAMLRAITVAPEGHAARLDVEAPR